LIEGLQVHCAGHLREVVAFFEGTGELSPPEPLPARDHRGELDLRDVRGQHSAKRALEIAATGGYNVLMVGPPGAGKTMLASRLPGLLPAPDAEEALEIATVASAGGARPDAVLALGRPFRAPHHSCSEAALVGGGDPIRPGEVSLSHGGVLFLDELPEFRRSALEALRPIMESGRSVVVRTRDRASMPARALLVAAMNPCPCGYAGHKTRICRCTPDRVERYRSRVSGPLLDRFDLHVVLPPVSLREVSKSGAGEDSACVRARVSAGRAFGQARVERGHVDARLPLLQRLAAELTPDALQLLHRSMASLAMSLRAYAKLLRISRTIADLAESPAVEREHVAEAVAYRTLDRDDPQSSAGRLPLPRSMS
jgi:magnesium chelatase family protein